MKQLTVQAVEDAILECLVEVEGRSWGRKSTSPTAVCEMLEKKGYRTMRGGYCNRRPDMDVFDYVCKVAQKVATYKLHGNTRSISL